MTICAVCNAPPPLTLTRNGLRCSKCLLGELELYRGIVSDLAACEEPIVEGYSTCALCEAFRGKADYKPTEPHGEFCPWRRAVDLKL